MIIPKGATIAMTPPYGGKPPVITHQPKEDGSGQVYSVQLVGPVGPLSQYLELITLLDSATSGDSIDIMINTPGGDVYTTMHLIERMTSSNATVTTIASGLVASAGTFIWFYGPNKRVDRWAEFMFHCSSHGDLGRSLEIQETATELVNYMKGCFAEMVAKGILTDEDVNKIIGNKQDVTLSAATIRARMEAFFSGKDPDEVPDQGNGEGDQGNQSVDDKQKKVKSDGDEGEKKTGEGDDHGKGDGDDDDFDPDKVYKEILGEEYEPSTEEPDNGDGGAQGKCKK